MGLELGLLYPLRPAPGLKPAHFVQRFKAEAYLGQLKGQLPAKRGMHVM